MKFEAIVANFTYSSPAPIILPSHFYRFTNLCSYLRICIRVFVYLLIRMAASFVTTDCMLNVL